MVVGHGSILHPFPIPSVDPFGTLGIVRLPVRLVVVVFLEAGPEIVLLAHMDDSLALVQPVDAARARNPALVRLLTSFGIARRDFQLLTPTNRMAARLPPVGVIE